MFFLQTSAGAKSIFVTIIRIGTFREIAIPKCSFVILVIPMFAPTTINA